MSLTYVIDDFNGEEIAAMHYEIEFKKTNQKYFRNEKLMQRKGDKIYVKWKCYDNLFNSWID